jgi:hypothetical protein
LRGISLEALALATRDNALQVMPRLARAMAGDSDEGAQAGSGDNQAQ